MALVKSEALVLRVIPFRDTSKVVTLYTAEHGMVGVLAKGVRGAKPKFGAALELFALVDAVYYQRESRDLQLLSQAALLDPHLGLTRDLSRYAHACGVLELLLRALKGQEPPGRLYPLSLRTLEVLETCPRESLPPVFRAFQIKAVSFLGHRPELFRCVECGGQVGNRPAFAPPSGGAVCRGCAAGVDGATPLTAEGLSILQRLLREPLADVASCPPPATTWGEVGRMLEAFLQMHIERYEPLRSLRLAREGSAAAGESRGSGGNG